MPGDAALVEEFAGELEPPLLAISSSGWSARCGSPASSARSSESRSASPTTSRRGARAVRAAASRPDALPGLEPSGEQGELDLSGIDDERFFHEAEATHPRGAAALRGVAAGGAERAATALRRRRCAGHRADRLVRTRFDVVLMNPPFGAAALPAKKEFEKAYPRTKNDLYAAFVERGIQLLHPRGMLGAITSRTGFFLSSFQKWREEILLKEAPPVVFADLGYGVLDAAMVEVAAYCLEKGRTTRHEDGLPAGARGRRQGSGAARRGPRSARARSAAALRGRPAELRSCAPVPVRVLGERASP